MIRGVLVVAALLQSAAIDSHVRSAKITNDQDGGEALAKGEADANEIHTKPHSGRLARRHFKHDVVATVVDSLGEMDIHMPHVDDNDLSDMAFDDDLIFDDDEEEDEDEDVDVVSSKPRGKKQSKKSHEAKHSSKSRSNKDRSTSSANKNSKPTCASYSCKTKGWIKQKNVSCGTLNPTDEL
jgi:hypothetical protein